MNASTALRSLAALAFLLAPLPAHASGLVVLRSAGEDALDCVHVTSQQSIVEMTPDSARASTTTAFHLPEDADALVLVPVVDASAPPPAAALDGAPLALRPLDTGAAAELLLTLARERPTPELLALTGLQARVAEVHLAAGSHTLAVDSAPAVARDAALVHLVQPLRPFGTTCDAPAMQLDLTLRAPAPVGAVFTPFHERTVTRVDAHTVRVAIRTQAGVPCHDAHVYLATGEGDVAASLLSYRAPTCDAAAADGEPGYLLLAAGPTTTGRESAVAKDLSLVVDTSGSMGGEKIAQVQRALRAILEALGPDDRFELVTFAGEARALFNGLRPASDAAARAQAFALVDRLVADGSTNISDALELALSGLGRSDGERPRVILFLTDGAPTAGLTDADAILAAVARHDELGASLFPFGVGYDVNTYLLDELARRNRARAIYVTPGQDIHAALATFYSSVQAPVLTDLALGSEGVTVGDLEPSELPDLYAGSEALVLGRYGDGARARLVLSGQSGGAAREVAVRGDFMRRGGAASFLPRLWASRRLGRMLYDARLEQGGDPVALAQLQALALRHGFVTRWTPFYAGEDGVVRQEYHDPTADRSGSDAVGTSAAIDDISNNSNAAAYSGGGHGTAPLRQVGDRTFVLDAGRWRDTTLAPDAGGDAVLDVRFGGADWARLAQSDPELAARLAVGRNVLLEWRCAILRVTDAETVEDAPAADALPESIFEAPASAEDVAIPPVEDAGELMPPEPVAELPVEAPGQGGGGAGAGEPRGEGGGGDGSGSLRGCRSAGGAGALGLVLVALAALVRPRRRAIR